MGATVVPLVEGKPMPREEFLALPEAEREQIETKRLEMMRKVDETYSRLHDLEKEISEKMREIELKAGEFALAGPFEDMFKRYTEYPEIINFLKEVKDDPTELQQKPFWESAVLLISKENPNLVDASMIKECLFYPAT
jgi:hypothetical protein